MEEMIRTRVLTGKRKQNYDENFTKVFGEHKPISKKKKAYFNNDGILIKENYSQGADKFKILKDAQPSKKYTDGMF